MIALLLSSAAAAQTNHPASATKPLSREAYAGDAACATCHEKESKAYESNAHHLTSQPADAHSIAGSFAAGANIFKTSNPSLYFKMTADDRGFYQTAVDEVSPGKSVELTARFDIVVGAASKSQTFLYWKGDDLFELPVSWWTKTNQWINSPGYEDGALRYNRAVVPRCLECHGSFFESHAPPSNRYVKSTLVLGITCEKCHGPGAAHVALYRAEPHSRANAPKAIMNPASLSRSRQIDACALCHSGVGEPLAPALSFMPGDTLDKFIRNPAMDPALPVDVHGNQVQLLERSKCFQSSQMTCSTCHDAHEQQRDAASYSHYCLDCHKAQQCGKFKTLGPQIANNCVDCHMPLKPSQALFSNSNDQTLQLPVREHRIAIYTDASQISPHH